MRRALRTLHTQTIRARAAGFGALGLLATVAAAGAQPAPVVQIATGFEHSCALTAEGEVWCWGGNAFGQLGDGSTQASAVPVRVSTATPGFDSDNVVAIDVRGAHSCAITATGQAFCWGMNADGQLGTGDNQRRLSPAAVGIGVADFDGVAMAGIATGTYHTCAVTAAGRAFCWGRNETGQLGDDSTANRTLPTPVSTETRGFGIRNIASVAAGVRHSCAVTTLGRAYCWGDNVFGAVGDGTAGLRQMRTVPTPVNTDQRGFNLRNIASIDAGNRYSCALTDMGRSFCWGWNYRGGIGDGTLTDRFVPTGVDTSTPGFGMRNIAAVSTGDIHACALNTLGRAFCWGENHDGQLGDGTTTVSTVPVAVDTRRPRFGARNIASIAAGSRHTCALTTVGQAFCWGRNTEGQLGDGSGRDRLVPVAVRFPVTE